MLVRRKGMVMSLLCAALVSSEVLASVAVVDLEVLLNNSKSYSASKAKLEAQVKREQTALEQMGKEIEGLGAKLEKNRSAMAAQDVEKAQKELMEKQNAYATKQMTVQRELYKSNQDALNAAFEQIRVAASKVAKDKKVDMIVPKSETIYAEMDLTHEVKSALGDK